ncbi:MAG: 4Fe-4S binding protein [Mariprofundaceae bacterium]
MGKGKRYRYDYDRCTGCAVCFEQCPCYAIEMVDEYTNHAGPKAPQR